MREYAALKAAREIAAKNTRVTFQRVTRVWRQWNKEGKMYKRKRKAFKQSVLTRLDELQAELTEAKIAEDADWIQDIELEIEELLEKGKYEDV